ncbi:MAG: hypothetical protein CMP10_19930 [Zetaproteobacteria bacterium]|nr:hypothetical protein [Pseudobdellovibrionaceae bacterium]
MGEEAKKIDLSSENDPNLEKIVNLIQACGKTAMVSRLSLNDDDVTVTSLTGDEDLSYDHWVCVIMVIFKGLRTSFQVHFTSQAARALTSIATSKGPKELKPGLCHDFMREYCNLAAGSVKLQLDKCDFQIESINQTMLPVEEPSYDLTHLEARKENWYLTVKAGDEEISIVCSAKLEVENAGILKNINKLDDQSIIIDDAGEIEFL